ncbi:Alpha/Beta hydrolase protein [Microdochium trichocladiopsis]|uniref:Alpha/Beta hydrolase protein n=1 Tax=Microdochium trichocladiopsis TaxID=1682393 RepID=A0A9P8XWN2_9PEZI|nr:Alpha/Beta hydrolase protein [Microdochium trichocladiopsis]KAH7021307.1 Alpha/Beta hydrolase protein [Microdochium trichocladiopsis]
MASGNHKSDYQAYRPLDDTFRVLSFDSRGHGESSATKPYTFEQIVDDIDGMRKHFVGNDRIILIGGSFGGFLAQHYAIKYPSNLTHLVLRGTAPSYHQEEDAIKTLEQRIAKAPSFSVEMLKNKVFGAYESDLEFQLVHLAMLPLYSEAFDANAALQHCLHNVYNAESHNDLYAESEKYFDYRDRLPSVTAKTLVFTGDKDWICPPEHSVEIARRIPGASLFIVENANHSVHLEKPVEVLGRIRAHLAS